MSLTKIGSIGINTGIAFAGVTTITTLNGSDAVLSVGGTVNFVSDVSIGGTVSIAGTLTYEDVTNVDAVGLITARDGIVVGSGITLSKDGDIFATGVTTSTTFSGSGANLTNIPDSAISALTASKLTGALPAISGANLTGISGVSVANQADNRVITNTGTTDALNAEANLFFNGSQLGVNVTPDSGVHLHVQHSGEANMILEGDVNGQGGFLMLKNNSDNANTTMSIQNLDAGGQGTSEISFKNVSNANNEGEMSLKTRPSGGSMTEQMNISSAGHVIKPNNLCLQYTRSASTDYTSGTIVYNTLVFDVNSSGAYNTSTGVFTAPVTGVYLIYHEFYAQNNAIAMTQIDKSTNGGSSFSSVKFSPRAGGSSSEYLCNGVSFYMQMNANDQFRIVVKEGTVHLNNTYTHFQVQLIQ